MHNKRLVKVRKALNRKNFNIFLLVKNNLKRMESIQIFPIKVEIIVARTIP